MRNKWSILENKIITDRLAHSNFSKFMYFDCKLEIPACKENMELPLSGNKIATFLKNCHLVA
jgi:hypothetical protein